MERVAGRKKTKRRRRSGRRSQGFVLGGGGGEGGRRKGPIAIGDLLDKNWMQTVFFFFGVSSF